MNENFLLKTGLSKKLYFECAESLPIIDYHNHLSVSDIKSDRIYKNITEMWISSDPYKHRAMRILGVSEKYITGNSSDYEKFFKWYECLPMLAGNPLFDWSHLELYRIFGIDLQKSRPSPEQLWNDTKEQLKELSAKKILEKFNIEYSAPCAAFCDDLSHFNKNEGVVPSLRGDSAQAPDISFVMSLCKAAKTEIRDLDSYFSALSVRIDDFVSAGCKFSDHALDCGFRYVQAQDDADRIFQKLLDKKQLTSDESAVLSSATLKFLGRKYAEKNMTLQLHIGALRKTSTRLCEIAGPAGGYAAIGTGFDIPSLVLLLDDIEKGEALLPKVILFNLDPSNNAALSSLCGSFSKDGVGSVVTHGPAWWWCDHYGGMKEMLESFSSFSVLSTFVGMTTDSRSLLSFTRHEYFRRTLCAFIGDKVIEGTMPDDFELLSDIVKNICYYNAKKLIKTED